MTMTMIEMDCRSYNRDRSYSRLWYYYKNNYRDDYRDDYRDGYRRENH